jgi:hypothetical protein
VVEESTFGARPVVSSDCPMADRFDNDAEPDDPEEPEEMPVTLMVPTV